MTPDTKSTGSQSKETLQEISWSDYQQFDKRAYQRQYNRSARGKEVRKKYRHANSKHITDAVYLSRPIIAIDGEGVNVAGGEHLYILLAISGVPPLINRDGLSTLEIVDYLWKNLDADNLNVIYGGSYDFNCWAASLVKDELRYLYKSGYRGRPFPYRDYELRWIKGKGFHITKEDKTVVINDVISFFQRSFVQACDEYLGGNWEGRDIIVREKARRGNFTVEELENVGAYNSLELDRLVDLVNELRIRLNKVGLRPRLWNSPGAIAAALFLREGVKHHLNRELPDAVSEAARYAYAGGRFEMIKYGAVK